MIPVVVGPDQTGGDTREDGTVERYARLTELGYQQAKLVMKAPAFYREPTGALRPSHVEHDLDLADLMLSLLPRRKATYVATRHGKATGGPVEVLEPSLLRHARWYHHSVFKQLAVYDVERDAWGRPVQKPKFVMSYEPDAILETDTFNETRYLIELDRGTEPLSSDRERSTIHGKLERIYKLIWEPWQTDPRYVDWHQRDSHYCRMLSGPALRRPKVVFVVTSALRAQHIQSYIEKVFAKLTPAFDVLDFFEVRTLEGAKQKFREVLHDVEAADRRKDRPWEVRAARRIARIEQEMAQVAAKKAQEAAAAKAKADQEREARNKAVRETATELRPRKELLYLPSEERAKLPDRTRRQVKELRDALYEEERTVRNEAENRRILDEIYHRSPPPPPPPRGVAAVVAKAASWIGIQSDSDK